MKTALKTISMLILALSVAVNGYGSTRRPAVAGTFYPTDSASLAKMVAGHLDSVSGSPEIDGQLVALIVPHAGLVYSGQIAAHGYKLLENSEIETVVLCGPSHRVGFEGISVYGPDIQWMTPMGTVDCDDAVCRKLVDFDRQISVIEEAHTREHCLEVQLPYLQSTLTDFRIVPMLIGYANRETIKLCADALSSIALSAGTIMVASTDWQHYRPAESGWPLDSVGIDCIKRLDPDALEFHLYQDSKTEACGGAAAVAVLKAAIAKGANKAVILKYGDSGDVSGDKSGVVGYVAAAIYRTNDSPAPSEDKTDTGESTDTYELTESDRSVLLRIARASIDSHLNKKPMPPFELSPVLKQDGAAFVTLTKDGRLRGCIGYTMAFKPLHETVAECAVKAAVQDPRFPPVTSDELPDLHIEVSVLTPLQKVASLGEVKVGRDGLMITLGRNRGLLLPQVATDYGWTETEFLQQTCRKAGLPLDAYLNPNAVIERFQALVFEEAD